MALRTLSQHLYAPRRIYCLSDPEHGFSKSPAKHLFPHNIHFPETS